MFALTLLAAAAAPIPGPTAELIVEPRGEFTMGRGPLAVSPAGGFLALGREDEKSQRGWQSCTYVLLDKDGGNPRELFRSPIDHDDVVVRLALGRPFWPDGSKVIVATTADGKPSDGRDAVLRAAVRAVDGTRMDVLPADGTVCGATFAGDKVVYLDTTPPKDPATGFKLKAWDGRKATTIHADPELKAFLLSVSPDGGKVAVFVFPAAAQSRSECRLRVVDLATGKASTSAPIPHAYPDNGLEWAADGSGLYFVCRADGPDGPGKPVLMRADLGALRPYKFGPDVDGRLSLFDADHLLVERDEDGRRRQVVVRVADGERFAVPRRYDLQGRFGLGGPFVVYDIESKAGRPARPSSGSPTARR